jgi:hypothetical protein
VQDIIGGTYAMNAEKGLQLRILTNHALIAHSLVIMFSGLSYGTSFIG